MHRAKSHITAKGPQKILWLLLLLCGGSHHVLRRVTPYFGSCTWLTVLEYDECATKAQPLLADVVALRTVLEFQ